MISKNSFFKINDEVIVRDTDKICFDRNTGWTVELNPMGYIMVKLLNGKYSMGNLVSYFSQKFQISEKQIFDDFSDFILELEKRNLIEKCK